MDSALNSALAVEAIARVREAIPTAKTIEAIRLLESRGAYAYWGAWNNLSINFPKADLCRVPDHWRTFKNRVSPLTESPRLAANPVNAMLNYLYAVLESEARLAVAALGLDPGLGVLHADTPARDSLACDVMEPVRPMVDAYLLNWITHETLRREWFFEQRDEDGASVKRLLVVGKQIKRLKCIEWSEWKNHNLLDFQGLLLDFRGNGAPLNDGSFPGLLAPFMHNGHEIFVILPENVLQGAGNNVLKLFTPVNLRMESQKGQTLKIIQPGAFINAYRESLIGHQIVLSDHIQPNLPVPSQWNWNATITDNVARAVCGRYGTAHVLHPPAKHLEHLAVNAILEYFSPTYEEPEAEERPAWATEVAAQMPGVADIHKRIDANSNEISRLKKAVQADRERAAELEQWAELLWLEGIPLQNRVAAALNLLGVPTESTDPTGHLADLQATCGAQPILFEVTGSTGSIGIDKGRQLFQWVAQSNDPTNTKGVLVANAFRKNPPSQRPPTPDHKIFVKECEELALKFHLALVDVRDLYELIVRKFSGSAISSADLCLKLQGDGIVKLT